MRAYYEVEKIPVFLEKSATLHICVSARCSAQKRHDDSNCLFAQVQKARNKWEHRNKSVVGMVEGEVCVHSVKLRR